MIKRLFKKLLDLMIQIGNTVISVINIGSATPVKIDWGNDQVWPETSPTSHTYTFEVSAMTGNVGYNGGTLVIYVKSRCDGDPQEVSYIVQENGQTPSWIHFLQRQENPYNNYNYTYYFGISSNSGSVRHAGFTFTQSGSSSAITYSMTQNAYTTAFDGLTIKASASSQYGTWVIGTIDNGMGGPPPTYPNRGVVIACDQPITASRRISYNITASRLKSLPTPSSGTSSISLSLTQTISAGATVRPVTSGSGKTYYGAYVVLTDTSFQNGEWVNTPGTHTTMSPYPSQDASGVSITNVFST